MGRSHDRRNANPRRRWAIAVGPSVPASSSPVGLNRNGTIRTTTRPAMTEPRAEQRHAVERGRRRTAREIGGITTRVRSWAVSMKASPSPRRVAATNRGTSDSAAGRIAAMPIPWKTRASEEGPDRTARLDPRQRQDHAAGDVCQPADREGT